MQAFNPAKRRKSPAPRGLRLPRTDDTVPYCALLPVLIRRRINREGGGGPRGGDRPPAARAEATRAIFACIEVLYNRTRRRSSIGHISPIEMELKAAQTCPFFRGKITEIIEVSQGVRQGS